MPLRDGPGFLAFDALVSRCVPGDDHRSARIRQVIASQALSDFMQAWDRAAERGMPAPGSDELPIRLRCGTFRPAAMRFRPSSRTALGSVGLGAMACAACVLSALAPRRRTVLGPSVMLVGTGPADVVHGGSDARFVEFCRAGPVATLHRPSALVVQHSVDGPSDEDPGVEYARRPLYRLVQLAPLGAIRRMQLVGALFAAMARVVARSTIDRCESLLARDRVESVLIRTLARHGIVHEVMQTNSGAASQPLWLRDGTVRSSMAWYSENTKWVWDFGETSAELPVYRHLSIGEHWVWTEAHRKWLRGLGHRGPCHSVGPILWYLPRSPTAREPSDTVWITVFDIVPVTDSRAVEIGFVDNYYSTARCLEFLRGIVAAVQSARGATGLDLRLRIKPKRIQPFMAADYAAELEALTRSGILTLMDPAQDLFEIVRESALSVVQPFSSPALVAAHTGARACYFDAGGVLERPADLDPAILFAQDQDSLKTIVIDAVRSASHPSRHTSP